MDINTCLANMALTPGVNSLAGYACLVPAAISIILAIFVLRMARDRVKAYIFAGFVGVFALWLISDWILWTNYNYYIISALWSPMYYFEIMFMILIFLFFYFDLFGKIPLWLSGVLVAVGVVPIYMSLTGQSVQGFVLPWCNMNDNLFLVSYVLYAEIAILITILGLGIYRIVKSKGNRGEQVRLGIVTGSIVLFMGIFSGAEYIASNLAALFGGNYTFDLYGLFPMPIFLLLLTIAITNYETFSMGNAVASVLFYIFLITSGAEFFFVSSPMSLALTTVAFLMTLSFGGLLLLSYNREAHIRAEKEVLATELEDKNGKLNEKTSELNKQLAEIERMNKYMVDRELKMVELKKENEELKSKSLNK